MPNTSHEGIIWKDNIFQLQGKPCLRIYPFWIELFAVSAMRVIFVTSIAKRIRIRCYALRNLFVSRWSTIAYLIVHGDATEQL